MAKAKVKTFHDLVVWQKAHQLVLCIYKISKHFPPEEKFGLAAQIRSSANSVASNIVEGQKRSTTRDFLRFLNLSASSLEETKYHLLLSRDLEYLDTDAYEDVMKMCNEVGWLLFKLQQGLVSRNTSITPTTSTTGMTVKQNREERLGSSE